MKPNPKGHILVIRLSAMGDVAMTVPVIAQLRRAYPELRITMLTRPLFKPFFRDISNVDFLEPDFKGTHKGLRGLWRLYRQIVAMGVDRVADLHDVLRTKLLRVALGLTGIRVAKIDKGRAQKRAMTRKFRKFINPLTPTLARYRKVFLDLGFEMPMPVAVPLKRKSLPQPILEMCGEKVGVWVGFAPFAQHKGKIYPNVLSDELIGELSAKYDRVFLFGGGKYEREFTEVMQTRHASVVSVIGRLSIDQELDLMSNLDCMITMDSASMHMASLESVPVVSVWGATHPYAGFYGFGQDMANAVQLDLPCRPCSVYGNKPCLYKDYRCLEGVTPGMVVEKVDSLLKAKK